MTSTCQVSLPPSAVFEPPSLIVVIIIYLPSRIWQLLKAKTTLEMPTDWTLNIPLYLGIAQVAPLHVWVPLPQCGLISKVRTYFSVSNSFIEEVMHTLLHAVDLPWLCKFVCHLDTAFKSQQTDDLSNCEPASSWLVCWCRAAQSTNENWRGALDAPRRMSVSFLSKKKNIKRWQQKKLCDWCLLVMAWCRSWCHVLKSEVQFIRNQSKIFQNHPNVCDETLLSHPLEYIMVYQCISPC